MPAVALTAPPPRLPGRYDVAVKIAHDEHVELLRPADHLLAAVVHDDFRGCNSG